jgi:hypothetical protein
MEETNEIKRGDSDTEEYYPFVRIIQLGDGSDEYAIEGNSDGLKKLSEGLINLSNDQPHEIGNLMHSSSDVYIAYCQKYEGVVPKDSEVREQSLKDKLIDYSISALLLSIPVFALIGLISSIYWLLN